MCTIFLGFQTGSSEVKSIKGKIVREKSDRFDKKSKSNTVTLPIYDVRMYPFLFGES